MVKTLSSTCEKAIAKALHAHIFLESVLIIKLQQMLFNDGKENTITLYDIMTAEGMEDIEMILSSDQNSLEMANAEVIKKLDMCMGILKTHLSSESRTAKLWIQYVEYVSIMRQFCPDSQIWRLELEFDFPAKDAQLVCNHWPHQLCQIWTPLPTTDDESSK